jgi:hypothetical protein
MAVPSLAALWVLRRRTSALLAFLFSLFTALLVVTPRPLGSPYDFTDHAMLYNRFGEAFILVLAALVFLPPRQAFDNRRSDWAEGALTGFLLVALLGCKVNYFIVGVLFFGAAIFLRRISPVRAFACVAGGGAILATALLLTGIPLSSLCGDFRIVGACQSPAEKMRVFAIQGMKSLPLLPLLLLFAWEAAQGERLQKGRPRLWVHPFVVTTIFAGGVLLLSSNAQAGEICLLASAALYIAEIIRRQTPPPDASPMFGLARNVSALLLVLFFLLPTLVTDLKTMRHVTFATIQHHWVVARTLESTPLRDFRLAPDGSRQEEIAEYRAELDEGMQLLRDQLQPDMRLNALLFANPFHIALGLSPANGGMLCVAGNGMSRGSHPSLDRVVGNATHILVRRADPNPHDAYGAEWDSMNLELVAETKRFALYKVPQGLADRLKKVAPEGASR